MKRCVMVILVWVMFTTIAFSQTVQLHRTINFKPGDEYQKQTLLNSSCLIQRGTKSLEIISSTDIKKNYCVTNVTDDYRTLSASIQDMDVLIKVKQDQLHFNSRGNNDSTSKIVRALQFMISKPDEIFTDKYGRITFVRSQALELVNDTLLRFAGIEPEPLYSGRLLSFIGDFADSETLHKGYTWTDSTSYNHQKIVTRFTIDEWTVQSTTVKYKSNIVGESINSNTNGTFVVDNDTGLILQNLMQTVSIGYQVANGVVYATTRRYTLNETTAKVNSGDGQPMAQPYSAKK